VRTGGREPVGPAKILSIEQLPYLSPDMCFIASGLVEASTFTWLFLWGTPFSPLSLSGFSG